MSSLQRFYAEQNHDYSKALEEVRRGMKVTHWIWYIFPQIKGLGRSETAKYYGIENLDEAKDYLADPVLGPRLVEITEMLLAQKSRNPVDIFGYIDSMKVRSCMTLFEAACDGDIPVFGRVLDEFYGGNRDSLTLDIIDRQNSSSGQE